MATERLVQKLSIVTLVLIGIHVVNLLAGGPSWQVERLFHLGLEGNLVTWFSSLLWALAALAAYQCFQASAEPLERRLWRWMSAGMLVLSIDEVAMIHESFGHALSKHFLSPVVKETFRATVWPVVLGPLVLFTVIVFSVAIWYCVRESVPAGRRIFLGVLMMLLGGWFLETTTNFLNHGPLEWLWQVEIIAEESLEMFGVIVLFSGLLIHQKFLKRQLED